MIERASPVQLRKALEVANLFAKMGIAFVPMPVFSNEEYDTLAQQAMGRLDEIANASDHPEIQSPQPGEA